MASKELTAPNRPIDLREQILSASQNSIDTSPAEKWAVVSIAGPAKWIDLEKFSKGKSWEGKSFTAALLTRNSYVDVKGKLCGYYTLQLISSCPITYDDEDGERIEGIAEPGDLVQLRERAKLTKLSELLDIPGLHLLAIKPHSPISIGSGQTMWTFDILHRIAKLEPEAPSF